MNKKYTYIAFGTVAVAAVVLVIIGLFGRSKTPLSASIFGASPSDIVAPPINMNSLNPSAPDQTNFAINSESYNSRLSADGKYIVFTTESYVSEPGLVPNPTSSSKVSQEQ